MQIVPVPQYSRLAVIEMLRAASVVRPPVEVELQDLIISAQLAASQDTLSGTERFRSVKLL